MIRQALSHSHVDGDKTKTKQVCCIWITNDKSLVKWFPDHVLKETWHSHDDVTKWKHFPCYWPFVRGIHRSAVNSPHKGQWRGALMFSLICVWINGWVSNRKAGDLKRYRAHYDVIVINLGCSLGVLFLKWLHQSSIQSHWECCDDIILMVKCKTALTPVG